LYAIRVTCRRYEKTTEVKKFFSSAGPPKEWAAAIPSIGMLNFDYLSRAQAPSDAKTISNKELHRVVESCGISLKGGKPELPEGWIILFFAI
jgi:hypothetical protein